ncbi:hypothetical protein ACHSBP_21360 [Pseudoalteromonas sp. XMcav1-K]|uniref:hypothetical protein n=1 Tax=Pseudoalteromonas sp. XMcav1-K TaxID=3374372 RepID=UPI0037570B5D
MLPIPNLAAVVIAFEPDCRVLNKLLTQLSSSVEHLIVVFNSDYQSSQIEDFENLLLIQNNENLGIAEALNQGVRKALALDASKVVLFDQDSDICSNHIPSLYNEFLTARKLLPNVAALSPRFFNIHTGIREPFYSYNKGKLKKDIYANSSISLFYSDFSITSSILISSEVFSRVGLFDSKLFIDQVDTEWNFRVKKNGYIICGTDGVQMKHSLGEEGTDFFGKKVYIHSPFRVMYQLRNSIRLAKSCYMPKWFLIKQACYLLVLYSYIGFKKRDLNYFKSLVSGLVKGLFSKH